MEELQEKVHAEIQELRRIYQTHSHELVPDPDATLPPELFHYTSIEGLKGILENRCLWCTHFEYLNDSTEVLYGRTLANKVIQERIDTCSELAQAFLHQMFDRHQVIYRGIAIYLARLCDDGDLLSQWRSYGSEGGGCAVGFKPRLICAGGKPVLQSPQQLGFGIAKVIYDEEEQRRLALGLVDRVFRKIEEYLEAAAGDLTHEERLLGFMRSTTSPLAEAMLYLLFQMAYRFKHPSFREEHEWRFVYILSEVTDEPGLPDVRFRARNGLLIPYIEIPIHNREKDALCFDMTRIRYGPTSKPDLMRKSIEMFLRKAGFKGVAIEGSGIPLRA
jgi:Protein of unknown function (DUF2971)